MAAYVLGLSPQAQAGKAPMVDTVHLSLASSSPITSAVSSAASETRSHIKTIIISSEGFP